MKLQDIDLTSLDLFLHGDPHQAFKVLRAEAPVYWHDKQPDKPFWSITKYDDAMRVYHDPGTFSSARGIALNMINLPESASSGMGQMMLMCDPPRHGQMRALINRRLTPRAIQPYDPHIRRVAKDIVDSVIGRGECDFVVDIAAKLPTAVICEMMGIARDKWDLMFALGNMSIGTEDPEYQQGRSAQETGAQTQAEVFAFFSALVADRRANPGEDLVSALIHGEIDGGHLTDLEVIMNCWLLIIGGQETTRNATSGGLLALIENPAQMARLKLDPSHTPTAIEEFLRYTSPVTHIMRRTTRETEFGGQKMRKYDPVVIWNISANRDEDVFENPEQFDITRTPNDHLAFGHGEHFCVGSSLARLELKIMVDEVIRRMEGIELAGPVEKLRSNFVAGIKHMPIRFRRAEPESRTSRAA